jgi:hypothetical protein
MAFSYAVLVKNAMQDAIATYAGSAAKLRIYSGSVPATADASIGAAVLLAELTCATPFAAGSATGVLTAGTITQDSAADATGTPSFFRLWKSDGTTVVAQGTAGASASDLNLSGLSGGQIIIGGTVSVSSLTLTNGN